MISGFPYLDEKELRDALHAGKILSFLAPISSPDSDCAPDLSLLSEEEQRRFCLYTNPEGAMAFYCGRKLLRSLLQVLDKRHPPRIDISEHGKPFCSRSESPYFNLSHGGGCILISFCTETFLGVDVEDQNRQVPAQRLAGRFFSPAEQQWLQFEGDGTFIKVWTRKEARLKASGQGLTVPAAKICTLSEPGWQYDEVIADGNVYGVVAYPGKARPQLFFKECGFE